MSLYLALAIAYIVPFSFLAVILWWDLYGTSKVRIVFLSLIWGLLARILAILFTNELAGFWGDSLRYEFRVATITPFVEEFLKALILILIVARADFNYVVDGAVYGFSVGVGFAISENFTYIMSGPEQSTYIAIARVLSVNLIHATGTSIIGSTLAFRRGNASKLSWLVVVLGFIISVGFHMTYNLSMSSYHFLFASAFGGIGLGFIWYIIHLGLNAQKRWVIEKLSEFKNEFPSGAFENIEEIEDQLYMPIKERFGTEKVQLIKRIISKQVELGIKRKLLETIPQEERGKREVMIAIDDLKKEVDVLRPQIGVYCMMMVRGVYMDVDVKVWDQINARIAEKKDPEAGGLWDRVNAQIAEKKDLEAGG
jgi:RsiW-degrading membrane proteinase PrsW (M82 family)